MSSSSEDVAAMSLDQYIASLHISFEEIRSATNGFARENLLKGGKDFWVYKGQLLQSGDLIDIVARGCRNPDDELALNEMRITKNLRHKNIATPFKLCRTDYAEIIINKYEVNESLDKHLSRSTLSWMQRLHICVRVAHALKYLHFDAEDDYYIIHGNIKRSKILLDDKWEPKLHGFAFAARVKRHHIHLMRKYQGSKFYMDPAYVSTGGLTHKSDVFSFGVLLFEVLFGTRASIEEVIVERLSDNWYFSRLAKAHYEERKLDDLIDPRLRKQMNLQSLNIFAETAYYCLKEKRSERPNINQVLFRLEKALEFQKKHEHSAVAVEGTSSSCLKVQDQLGLSGNV